MKIWLPTWTKSWMKSLVSGAPQLFLDQPKVLLNGQRCRPESHLQSRQTLQVSLMPGTRSNQALTMWTCCNQARPRQGSRETLHWPHLIGNQVQHPQSGTSPCHHRSPLLKSQGRANLPTWLLLLNPSLCLRQPKCSLNSSNRKTSLPQRSVAWIAIYNHQEWQHRLPLQSPWPTPSRRTLYRLPNHSLHLLHRHTHIL